MVTVPLLGEGNRPYIDLTFVRPDGTLRVARAVLDTGGGAFVMSEPLARELGLEPGAVDDSEGVRLALTAAPSVRAGDLPLSLTGVPTLMQLDTATIYPGYGFEVLVPGRLLRQYRVIFDYPAGELTLAQPGTLTPRGVPLASPIHPESGFPRIEVEIAGERYGMLLDTGASYTMISGALLERLSQ